MHEMSQPSNSSNVLEQLLKVQKLDLELDKLKFDEASIPGDLAATRDEKAQLLSKLETTKAEHAAVRRQVNSAELELKDLTAKRDRAKHDQQNSSSVKEQSQYTSVILQLDTRIEDLENDSLPLIEKMETLAGHVAQLEGAMAELEPKLNELESLDDDRIKALQAEFDSKMGSRNDLAEDIDFGVLREYDAVRKAKKGAGIVPITMGKCGGCKMQLPMNIVQRVVGGAVPVKCPSCGRILMPNA
jgi:uncharacterized protein